ncbi:Acetyl-CoA:oxalate CoA-transferase [Aquicella siphonis]|uniref:Acetyl-CoA:oxalate CoA-transferase n=1 Tax=Aquicella siphonis TaxID=254247 RepID=A0A5E4PEF6_9COXI|nr:CoA transferase [Aquicella siphonis]VVC74985.1 Acetyl-CoA:oxalate CoA-transferase [Aquicella siphonis]
MFSTRSFDITELAATQLSLTLMDTDNIKTFGLPTSPLGAFSGIPIIGITEHIAGPGALSTLVEDGAIGISIEPPTGDPARKYLSHECYSTFNAGKISIAMKLKEDVNYIKILREAIIIIDNRSKRARDGDQVLQAFLNDPHKSNRIIYCYISGFPGEEEARPGNDVTVQAASGMAYVNGTSADSPLKVGFLPLDIATANWAVIAIQSRFIQMLRGIPIEDENNKVIPVHVSLAGVASRFLCSQYLDAKQERPIKQRTGNQDNLISLFSFFQTQDGRNISIGTLTDLSFKVFCHDVIARPDLSDAYATNELRIQANNYLHEEIQTVMLTQPSQYWLDKLMLAGVAHAEVNTVEEAAKKPYSKHFYSKTTEGTPTIARPDGRKPELDPAPTLNQHGHTLEKLLGNISAKPAYDFGKGKIHFMPARSKPRIQDNHIEKSHGHRRIKSI